MRTHVLLVIALPTLSLPAFAQQELIPTAACEQRELIPIAAWSFNRCSQDLFSGLRVLEWVKSLPIAVSLSGLQKQWPKVQLTILLLAAGPLIPTASAAKEAGSAIVPSGISEGRSGSRTNHQGVIGRKP